jgi:hypothetical protein
MDADFAEQFITKSTPANAHKSFYLGPGDEEMMAQTAKTTEKVVKGGANALSEIVKEMEKNERIAHFEEIKINTEVNLGVF